MPRIPRHDSGRARFKCSHSVMCQDQICGHKYLHRFNRECHDEVCDNFTGIHCLACGGYVDNPVIIASPDATEERLHKCKCNHSTACVSPCSHSVEHNRDGACGDHTSCDEFDYVSCIAVDSNAELIAKFRETYKGLKNAGKIPIMEDVLDREPIQDPAMEITFDGRPITGSGNWQITFGGEQIRGGGDMPQGTAHERMRFNTMTERQLWTRLGKITTHEKFQNFAIMARESGYEALAIAAEAKLQVSMGETNLSLGNKAKTAPKRVNGERLTRKLRI